MALVTLNKVLSAAAKKKHAIAAFNVDCIEIVQSLMETVEAMQVPVIFAVGQAAIRDEKLELLADVIRYFAKKTALPVVSHLDHGQSFAQCVQALRAGYSSVMIDGSTLSLQENIKITRMVAEAAHAVGASVEAELGAILGAEDNISHNTDKPFLVNIEDIIAFTDAVRVDALAIGIGNAHGVYKGLPQLDFARLAQAQAASPVPLVLHGGSGIPADMIKKAISLGIRKINVATEIRMAYTSGFASAAASGDFYAASYAGRQQVKAVAEEKIRLFY